MIDLAGRPVPDGLVGSRAVVAAHLVARAVARALYERARLRDVLRATILDAVLLETTIRTMGASSLIWSRGGFFPHIFLPDYHGPHFDEAIRRLSLPGRGPNILYFSITGRCPCACEYCFAGAGGPASPDLGDEPVLEVARRIARTRTPLVNISGGEPLSTYRRLLGVVRILSRACEVRMFTTGIGLTRERLVELREAGLRGVFVSLDTEDAAVFDAVRRLPGAMDHAVAALRLCAEERMLTFVNSVVGRSRMRSPGEIARFLRFVGSIHPDIVVNFLPQLATGRGAQADSFREPAECEEVANRIVQTATEIGRPATMLFGEVDRFMGCVGAGGKLLNVDIEGNVTVCISRAALGNVLEEDFEAIHARFVDHCRRLKVGFFCCEVGEKDAAAPLLDLAASEKSLRSFHARKPDATWQRILDRHAGLLAWLAGESVTAQSVMPTVGAKM